MLISFIFQQVKTLKSYGNNDLEALLLPAIATK